MRIHLACHTLAFLIATALFVDVERALAEESRWEKAIQAFEAQDAKQSPAKNGIAFVGSSSIRKWDLKKWFPDLEPINRGFGGSEVADSVEFADRIIQRDQTRRKETSADLPTDSIQVRDPEEQV